MVTAMLTNSLRKATRLHYCSCSFTNAFAVPSPTASSTRRHGHNPSPQPKSKPLIAKPISRFNTSFGCWRPEFVRTKSPDKKLKNLEVGVHHQTNQPR